MRGRAYDAMRDAPPRAMMRQRRVCARVLPLLPLTRRHCRHVPCRSLRARDPRHYHFHFDIFFIIDFHFLDAIIAAIDAIRRHAIFADASPSPIFITP
jgi:hypothetical protein